MRVTWNELKEILGKDEIDTEEILKFQNGCFKVGKVSSDGIEFDSTVCPVEPKPKRKSSHQVDEVDEVEIDNGFGGEDSQDDNE